VKEKKGPFGVMVGGIVDSVVQGARRRALEREPRALLYDESGLSRTVRVADPGGDDLITTAGALIDLVTAPPAATEEEVAAEEAAEAEAQTQADAEIADADERPGETTA